MSIFRIERMQERPRRDARMQQSRGKLRQRPTPFALVGKWAYPQNRGQWKRGMKVRKSSPPRDGSHFKAPPSASPSTATSIKPD